MKKRNTTSHSQKDTEVKGTSAENNWNLCNRQLKLHSEQRIGSKINLNYSVIIEVCPAELNATAEASRAFSCLVFFPSLGNADLHFHGSSGPSSLQSGCVTPFLRGAEILGRWWEVTQEGPLVRTDWTWHHAALAGSAALEPRQCWEPGPGRPSRSTAHWWTRWDRGGRTGLCIRQCMGQQQEKHWERQERGYCTWRQKQLCWQLLNK